MGRFSLEMEDDGDGPSSPMPKRARLSFKQRVFLEKAGEEEEESSQNEEEEEDDDDDEEEEFISEEFGGEEEEGEDDDDDIPSVRGAVLDDAGGKVLDRQSTTRSKVDGSITVTLTDPDVLDCPICLEPLTIPVFQCENGHVACSCCCSKLRNKCPSCTFPIGYNRCRAIEKVLESLKVSCRNSKYGCKDAVIYSKINDHEKTCVHLPITCPLPGCHFTAGPTSVSSHVSTFHWSSVTHFLFDTYFHISLKTDKEYLILQEKGKSLFVLNHDVDRLGSLVNVNSIGPSSTGRRFSYNLVAKNGGCSVMLQGLAENDPNWKPNTPQKAFLLVPYEIVGSHTQLELELRIRG